VTEVEGAHDWTLRVLLQCAADAGPGAAGAAPAPDEPAAAQPAPGRAQAARPGREGEARVSWRGGAGLGFSAAPRFDPQGAGAKPGADAHSEPRSPLTAARKGLRASRLAVSSQAERPSTEGPLDSDVEAGLAVAAEGAKAETDTRAAPRPDARPCAAHPPFRDGTPGPAPGDSDPSSPPLTPSGAPQEAEALSPAVLRAVDDAGAAESQALPVSADASRPQVSPPSTAPRASSGPAGAGQQEADAPSERDGAAPAPAPPNAVPVIQELRNVSFAAVLPLLGSSVAASTAPPDAKPEPRLWWADQAGTAAGGGGAPSPRLSRASSFARAPAPAAAAALPLLTPAERAAYVDMLVAKLDALLRAGRAAAGAAASQAASASSASPADAAPSAGFVLAPLSDMFRVAPAEGGAAGPGPKLHGARLPTHSLSSRAQLPGAGPRLPAAHAPIVAPAAHGQPAGQAPHAALPQGLAPGVAAGSAEAAAQAAAPADDLRSGEPAAADAAAAAAAEGGLPGLARARAERPRARSPPPSVPARFQHTLDRLACAAERAAPQEGSALDRAPAGAGGPPGAPMRLQVPAAVPTRLRAA